MKVKVYGVERELNGQIIYTVTGKDLAKEQHYFANINVYNHRESHHLPCPIKLFHELKKSGQLKLIKIRKENAEGWGGREYHKIIEKVEDK